MNTVEVKDQHPRLSSDIRVGCMTHAHLHSHTWTHASIPWTLMRITALLGFQRERNRKKTQGLFPRQSFHSNFSLLKMIVWQNFLFIVFESGFFNVAHTGLESSLILLPPSPMCWDVVCNIYKETGKTFTDSFCMMCLFPRFRCLPLQDGTICPVHCCCDRNPHYDLHCCWEAPRTCPSF